MKITNREQNYEDIAVLIHEFKKLKDTGNEIIHLTVVYNRLKEPERLTVSGANKIFANWYCSRLLPYLLNTKHYSKSNIACFQPVSKVFIDEHYDDRKTASIHHHAVLSVDRSVMPRIEPLLNDVLTQKQEHMLTSFKQIQSLKFTHRDEYIVTYAGKKYGKYKHDVMTFGHRA